MAALLASPPMASILLNPADEAFTPLNPISRSMSLPSQARTRRPSSSKASGTPQRRIKFAPLPDPRKNVLVTDAGEELPLPDVFDEKDTPTLVTFPPSPTAADSNPPTGPTQVLSYNLSPQPSTTSLGLSVSAPNSPRAYRRHSPARDANPGLAKKWLRPFRPRSRSRDRADASAPSTPATPRFDSSMLLGAPLSRWTSASSASSNRTALARTESREPKQAPAGARLMLNGRTYGGRRERQGPKTPYREPEFVEWGQGGMGAVRNTQWGKLQGDDPLRGRTSARTSTDNADEDDGSGMAWLRKRRAEREAKARAEREQAGDASASSASSTTSEKSSGDGGADTDVTAPDEGDDEHTVKLEEHEVKAVNVQQRPESESGEEDEEDSSEKERDEEDADAEADDDEEEDDNTRKTALGAGMEKVSRHHH